VIWALVKDWKKDEVMYHDSTKYGLLKRLHTREPMTRKSVKQLKEGDKVTVVYPKSFLRWKQDPETRLLFKEPVFEESEVTYMLKRLT